MKFEPIPIRKGKAKPPTYKIMSIKEAVSKFIHKGCYLGMSAPRRQHYMGNGTPEDRIKTVSLS